MGLIKKIFKRKKPLIIIGVVILIVVGVNVFAVFKKAPSQKTEIQKGTVTEELVLSGEVTATNYTQLYYPASGKVAWVVAKEGDWVKKGQALAQLDTIVLNSTYQTAKASLRAAEASFDKARDDVKNHASDETFTQRETRTTYEAAKDKAYEAVIAAEKNLREATLIAPFEGYVTYVAHPYAGVNVFYTEKQFEVLDPRTIYFEVTADQTEVMKLSKDQKVMLLLDSYPDEEVEGRVDYISLTPKEGESGTVYKVVVKFTDSDFDVEKLRIGMSGDARFIVSEKGDALYLPPKFINSDTGGKYVRLGRKNNKVYINVGIEGEDRTEVIEKDSSGRLKEGTTVYD